MSKFPSYPVVEVNGLTCVERNGEFWFPGTEIGRLLGYADPIKAVNTLYQRHILLLQHHSTTLNMRVVDGKARYVRVFDEEAAYYLCMKAETEKANEVSLQFARALKELRKQKMRELAARVKDLESEAAGKVEAALRLTPTERERIPAVLGYLRRGFSQREIALVMRVHRRSVQGYIRRIRQLGLAALGEIQPWAS